MSRRRIDEREKNSQTKAAVDEIEQRGEARAKYGEIQIDQRIGVGLSCESWQVRGYTDGTVGRAASGCY